MSDIEVELDDGSSDEPDMFEDRLFVIVRLIDTADEETEPHRRLLRRAVILRLLSALQRDSTLLIVAQLERLDAL